MGGTYGGQPETTAAESYKIQQRLILTYHLWELDMVRWCGAAHYRQEWE